MDRENHGTGVVTESGFGMGGCIIEEMGSGFGSGFGSVGLGRSEGSKSDKHGGVDGAAIEEEDTNDFLESSGLSSVEFVRGIFFGGELWGGAVLWFGPSGRSMLWSGGNRVLETAESSLDIARHGQIDSTSFVIPGESDATIQVPSPVFGHFVFGGNDIDEVLGIFGAGVLDAKIVDNQTEDGGTCCVFEEA